MINVELLERVKDIMSIKPRESDMGNWRGPDGYGERCTTTKCAAGWAAELADGKWLVSDEEMIEAYVAAQDCDGATSDSVWLENERVLSRSALLHPDPILEPGRTVPVTAEDRARTVLGLSNVQASRLFFSGDDEVFDIIDELIEEGAMERGASSDPATGEASGTGASEVDAV